jgi:hypothetical protein
MQFPMATVKKNALYTEKPKEKCETLEMHLSICREGNGLHFEHLIII